VIERPDFPTTQSSTLPRLSPEARDKLKAVSTATLCTALFKRGLRNQFIQDVHPLNPEAGPMVGEAFTLRTIPAREDLNPLSVFGDRPTRSARRWRSARPARCS
jgi:hypothetical protein